MSKVLIVADPHKPQLSLQLLEVANRISPNENFETYAFCIDKPHLNLSGHFDSFLIPDNKIEHFDSRSIAQCIHLLYNEHRFATILFPATTWGKDIAPRAAMCIGAGLAADITDIQHDENIARLVRPAFDGKLLAVIECAAGKPIMASVRADVFRYSAEAKKTTKVIKFFPGKLQPSGINLISKQDTPLSTDIRDSKILISCGGGTNETLLKQSGQLAKALGGGVSASRRLVDEGIAPRSIQVGQSGKIVSPKIYIALGIHGALQHIEGLKDVKHIISVNTDRNTPLNSISNIAIQADAQEFVQRLTEKITVQTDMRHCGLDPQSPE